MTGLSSAAPRLVASSLPAPVAWPSMAPQQQARTLALLATLVVTSACGGGPTLERPADLPTSATHSGTGIEVRVASGAEAVDDVVTGSASQVWDALVAVYEEVGIPVTEQDRTHGVLGNPRWITRGTFLGRPMSRYLNCGQSATGLNANVSRIEVSVRSTLSSSGPNRIRVRTVVTAVARNMEGSSNNRTQCASYQRMEGELLRRVHQRLEGGPGE